MFTNDFYSMGGNGEMKVVFVNGSPRKGHNTHKLAEAAMRGAQEAGADVELVHLADYSFKGCHSCFACKLKNSTTNGVCAVQDEIGPVLQRIMEADALVIAAPIYFGAINADTMAFLERLEFPIAEYKLPENGKRARVLPKEKKVGMIIDMGCPAFMAERDGYFARCGAIAGALGSLLGDGSCPIVYSNDTYQFTDYSKYDVPMFSEEAKRRQREEQFPVDLDNAYNLGRSIVLG